MCLLHLMLKTITEMVGQGTGDLLSTFNKHSLKKKKLDTAGEIMQHLEKFVDHAIFCMTFQVHTKVTCLPRRKAVSSVVFYHHSLFPL